jgi:hypothetical protein
MMNNVKKMLQSDFCKGYEIKQSDNFIIVKTPLRYDNGDHVVIFLTPHPDDVFIIDDNGEAATRLMLEGVDIESQPIQTWLKNLQAIHHIEWDDERETLWCEAHSQALAERVICTAQVSVQMQALIMTVSDQEDEDVLEDEEIEALLELLFLRYQFKFLLGI